jgi:hypothetical protein
MNPSQEHEIRKLLSFIKETESFVTLEDIIGGELSMEDHFVQLIIKRAALAASVLPCNDVPVVLTIKSSVIPSSVELAEFSKRVSKYLAARRPTLTLPPGLAFTTNKTPQSHDHMLHLQWLFGQDNSCVFGTEFTLASILQSWSCSSHNPVIIL